MTARPPSVLQVGCGSFGPTHLEVWRRLGLRDSLWVADPDPEARARAAAADIPAQRIVADYHAALGEADVRRAGVDIAVLYEAIVRSAQEGRPVRLEEPARAA
jgi:predicted dehydrogenase